MYSVDVWQRKLRASVAARVSNVVAGDKKEKRVTFLLITGKLSLFTFNPAFHAVEILLKRMY